MKINTLNIDIDRNIFLFLHNFVARPTSPTCVTHKNNKECLKHVTTTMITSQETVNEE